MKERTIEINLIDGIRNDVGIVLTDFRNKFISDRNSIQMADIDKMSIFIDEKYLKLLSLMNGEMIEINSTEELEKIHERGIGYVFNDFTGNSALGKRDNKLHIAKCPFMNPSHPNRMTVPPHKLFGLFYEETLDWLEKNRSRIGYTECKCLSE
ncbi:hypothetical protein A2Z22_00820 [Candidatus Woesebacteria bacterium RBG_16_34_12]|uniref:Uncharacterized protein n=1 Tax=Candidatus Woesebacteria bacterium RBG_16_34_12 TaxID=1802480 RepID=A0A1F7X6N3_9BACT|nr:MAG: hypothetical protein A2Z22_00820 [Candidatus Woesebacteria bacterium RBG_16_34_12]